MPALLLFTLVVLSGCAALSWEVVWQIKSSVSLGVSAYATSVTLAVTMGGMSAGALAMGRWLRDRRKIRPLACYGAIEIVIGICGLCLPFSFAAIENLDGALYAATPALAPFFHVCGIAAIIGPQALCLGATLPVLGLAARQSGTSIAAVYGLNTLGAAAGTLVAAFLLIPLFGVNGTILLIAGVNLAVGAAALFCAARNSAITTDPDIAPASAAPSLGMKQAYMIVAVTGFATFALEVAWFRSLTSAFLSTTDAFAIMLSCVLILLGLGAKAAPKLKAAGLSLGAVMAWSGILILAATPLVERFDLIPFYHDASPFTLLAQRFFTTFIVVGAPVFLLGIALPWLLDDHKSPREWSRLYSLNALAAVIGAIAAGWIFLPAIGFAKTAWLAGAMVAAAGLATVAPEKRRRLALYACGALAAAIIFESGLGHDRVQSPHMSDGIAITRKLAAHEGPDATIAAVETTGGHRMLIINGFITTMQTGTLSGDHDPVNYMRWMGHLPMILHDDPQNALVICFGTGQTVNAVRREKAQAIDVVDLNRHVFDLAVHFDSNEGVLDDPRVSTIVMDGRAFMRRTARTYDVITLEPMPPTFAGVNALYSREFYAAAAQRLAPGGIIAQWLPFHIVPAYYSAAIVRTFIDIFPNAALWVDPLSGTGIILGTKDETPIGDDIPGLRRTGIARNMTEAQIKRGFILSGDDLRQYAAHTRPITDDNQLLSYGQAAYDYHRAGADYKKENDIWIFEKTGIDISTVRLQAMEQGSPGQ